MREPDEATLREQRHTLVARRSLAVMWIAWAFWLVFRPTGTVEVDPDARRFLAIFGFAIVLLIVWGLLREFRWPVTASRGLLAALILLVTIGPAGREGWVYAIDISFAAVGGILAFGLIRIGTTPPPANQPEWISRRMEARRDRVRRDFRR